MKHLLSRHRFCLSANSSCTVTYEPFLSDVRNKINSRCYDNQNNVSRSYRQPAHWNSLPSTISIYNVHRCSLIQLEDVAVVIHKYVPVLPVKPLSWRWWGLYKVKCLFVKITRVSSSLCSFHYDLFIPTYI